MSLLLENNKMKLWRKKHCATSASGSTNQEIEALWRTNKKPPVAYNLDTGRVKVISTKNHNSRQSNYVHGFFIKTYFVYNAILHSLRTIQTGKIQLFI